MREKDAGPLDFDNPGGLDTTWHRIFLCLRSAYKQEALEVWRLFKFIAVNQAIKTLILSMMFFWGVIP